MNPPIALASGAAIAKPKSRRRSIAFLRALARDRAALVSALALFGILAACIAAPLYAEFISGTDPFAPNLTGEVVIDGASIAILESSTEGLGLGFTPIGPTWRLGPYAVGADSSGRDVAARLLYGGRNSLLIAGAATLITMTLGTLLGLTAGFFGGIIDIVLSRILDILWAFPVFLLAISLSIVLIAGPIEFGPISLRSGSLSLPIVIIGLVYVPYVARPVRGHVLSLMRTDFVLALVGIGAPPRRILLRDILPNVATRIIVFLPMMLALNISTESALSFLSIGVQPPDASWGTIVQDGQGLLYTRPMVAISGGLAIVLTVLPLNILGDFLRDYLDPKSSMRIA